MEKKILVVCKSVTGFTRQYAEVIAREVGGTVMDLKKVSADTMSQYDTVVFGGRMHAGFVDGLKKFRKICPTPQAVFAVGAMPGDFTDTVDAMWKQNFTPEELEAIPHFYMQGGLRYEKMPLHEKLMMKAFAKMLANKKDKEGYEEEAAKVMGHSYDCFSEDRAQAMIDALKAE